jgi:hypothetical protein
MLDGFEAAQEVPQALTLPILALHGERDQVTVFPSYHSVILCSCDVLLHVLQLRCLLCFLVTTLYRSFEDMFNTELFYCHLQHG